MRVTYREGQRIRADDLTEEQEYLIDQERRHNLEQHLPGVVSGLGHGTNPAEIEPGVAVNAVGQLLVVEDATPVDDKCIEAWLIHCETPGRPRRRGSPPCEPAQSDRRQETANVVKVAATPDASLRAPTSDAVFLGRSGCGDNDTTKANYTSINAASVKDPAGRSLMQVGPSSASDRNAFLISTAGSDGSLAPRIALERLGNNRFIGNVTLADYHYCELLRLTDDKVLTLVAKTPGSLGAALRLVISPKLEGTSRRIDAQIFSGTDKLGDALVWRESDNIDLSKDLKDFDEKFKLSPIRLDAVTSIRLPHLLDHVLDRTVPSVANERAALVVTSTAETFQQKEFFDRFAVQQNIQLHPCGGSLRIDDWHGTTQTKDNRFRGCDDVPPEDGETSRDPAGLSFKPMAEVPKAPPIPGIYSVRAGDKKNPIEELHLDLGKKRDSDLSTRFALGTHGANKGDPFVPWLEVNGISGVSLPFSENLNPQKPPTSVHVNGTIERGLIKPDMSDPTFINLMAMAWLAGLQKSVPESSKFEVSFVLPASVIETNELLTYDINVKNPLDHDITADGFIETLTVPNGNPHIFSAPIKPAAPIKANATSLARKVIHVEQTIPAGKINSHVVVYGKDAGLYWWKSQKATIQIAASPIVNLGGIPNPVPSNTAFDAIVVVRNEDNDLQFTVQTVKIDGQANATVNIDLPPQTSQPYTRHFAGISADQDIVVEVTYQWQGDTTARTISFPKTVHVHDDLDLTIQVTSVPTVNQPIKFDLTAKNDGPRKLTLTSIRQSLKGSNVGQTQSPDIPIGTASLASQEETTMADNTGAHLTSASNNVTLEIEVVYERDGRTWNPPAKKEKVI